MTRAELIVENEQLHEKLAQLEEQVNWLKEQFRLSRHQRFGASSEKTPDVLQSEMVFNEAEVVSDAATGEVIEPQTITYTRKPKREGHREEVLANLPTEIIEYRLPEDEQSCSVCGGEMHEMSTQVREELVIIPATVKVNRHVRYIYGCRHCEKNEISVPVVTAPAPKPLIAKSLASASAVAYVMGQKYVEAMPLYRIEKHFERLGIELPRAVLSNWMMKGGEILAPVYNRLRERLLQLDIMHADETTLQVLREPGRSPESKSYLWLYRSGRYGPPIVCYEYQATRDGDHARRFLAGGATAPALARPLASAGSAAVLAPRETLECGPVAPQKGFAGFLHADGYAGYNDLVNVRLVGCFAHARRKFTDAAKSLPEGYRKDPEHMVNVGLKYINRLFDIERELTDVSPDERKAARGEMSKPILDEFRSWLDEAASRALPKGMLGTAIGYCRNQWPKLIVFLDDGRLEIDNNRAERSIKPFVIGRKNWLFANTPKGARTSAVIYSIVETAKESGLDPSAYLEYLFERLPNTDTGDNDAIDSLLPWNQNVQVAIKTGAGAA